MILVQHSNMRWSIGRFKGAEFCKVVNNVDTMELALKQYVELGEGYKLDQILNLDKFL